MASGTANAADEQKRAAAAAALAEVEPGMRLGLGTGSTARHLVALLGEKVKAGFDVLCVPTSEVTAAQARALGIRLGDLETLDRLDLTIDGADEIGPGLSLIKGGGGALLREKIVATASDRMIAIADESKLVPTLGRFPLPVEIAPFGAGATLRAVRTAIDGLQTAGPLDFRKRRDGHAFVTDGGHWIVDAALGRIEDPAALARALAGVPGVMEHGLFIGLAAMVIVGGPDGVRTIERR